MKQRFSPQITGLRVKYCHHRVRFGALYYGGAHPAKAEDFDLLVVLDGKIEIKTAARAVVAAKGWCAIWSPGDPMVMKALPGTLPSYYMMGFTPQSESGKLMSPDNMDLERVFRIRDFDKIERLMNELNRSFNGNDRYRLIKCSILGLRLLLALRDPLPGPAPDNGVSNGRLDEAIAFIHKNYKRNIPVKTLADRVSLNPDHFIRAFRKSTGLTPHQYLLNLKVQKARDFLSFYRESPVITALELGFRDYAHFSRVFKRHTGLSPKEFRNYRKNPK